MLTGCMPCILRVDKLNNIGRIINMITVNAIGDTCPIPVVKTKKAIEALTQPDTVETLVDNEIAVENLKRWLHRRAIAATAISSTTEATV